MEIPDSIKFEYGMDPDSARYYGVIRLPSGGFLTTRADAHSVDEAERRAQELLREVLGLCNTARAD